MVSGNQLDSIDILDFGAHLLPESVIPDSFREFNAYVGEKHSVAAKYVRWMEETGVDASVLSQPYYMGHGDAERTATANDALLEELSEYPHLFGLAAIPTAAGGQVAAEELERSLAKGYHGGALATKSGGVELNDRGAEPILEIADNTGDPILVHPKLDESIHPEALDDTYRLNAIFGREAALSESIFKVIHDGVLDRYPDLNLVYHHLGGNVAAMMGRIHLQLDDGRWPEQDHVKSFEAFKSQLEDRIYIDTSGFFGYRSPVRVALEEFPSTQLLFGSDAPYEPRTSDELRRFTTAIEDVASDRVLSGNALDLLDV